MLPEQVSVRIDTRLLICLKHAFGLKEVPPMAIVYHTLPDRHFK